MKYLKFINIISLFFSTNFLIAQSWQWSAHLGSNQWDINGIAIADNAGNSYWAGIFEGGYCYSYTDTLGPRLGSSDFYLAKYDGSGNMVWWNQLGGNNTIQNCFDGAGCIAIDNSGFIYLVGTHCGTMNFGTFVLPSNGLEDGFVAKFDPNGNCVWAKNYGGNKNDGSSGITLDNDGNFYLCGTNNETATFDTFTISPGGFIAKYDTSGNCLWAKNKMGYTTNFGTVNTCTATPQGIKFVNSQLIINGNISNDTTFIDSLNVLLPTNTSCYYMAAFDTSGTIKWLNKFGGPSPYFPSFEHGVDAYGNSYATGTCSGQGQFLNDTLYGTRIAFLVKIDANGNEIWVREVDTPGLSYGNMTSSDSDGNIYITGKFSGAATFGSYNLSATTPNDMFVARYNSSGDCLGVRAFGEAEGFGVTQDANGNAYVCGNFDNTITIGGNTYTSYGDKDIFIAKLDEIVGISEEKITSNQLLIYSNPNAGKCTISVPDEFVNEPYLQLIIFDNSGKIIQQKTVEMNDGKIKLNLEAEAKGMYNVTLGNGKKIYSGKIIFE